MVHKHVDVIYSIQRDFIKNKRDLNSEWNSIEIAASQKLFEIFTQLQPQFSLCGQLFSICIKSKCESNVSDKSKFGIASS